MELLRRQEATPAAYPNAPAGLSIGAAALDPSIYWARIEAYTAYRWTARPVDWTVQGPGAWAPDLTPTAILGTEKFGASGWEAVSLDAEWNGGLYLEGDWVYRITADVGGGTVPAEVNEAARRLAEYFAERPDRAGVGRYETGVGEVSENFDRSAAWVARALQLSGAADLLRNYRRAP